MDYYIIARKQMKRLIDVDHLQDEIEKLKKSPWYNNGKDSESFTNALMYQGRKEAFEIIDSLCIRQEPIISCEDCILPIKGNNDEQNG